MRRRDTRPTEGPDVLRVRVGLKLEAVGHTSYLTREARAYGTSVEGLLEAAREAAPDDPVLAALLVEHRSSASS